MINGDKNADPSKTIDSKEELKRVPRFVVFGSRAVGSAEIAEHLREAVKEIPDSRVDVVADIQDIEDMFYGRFIDPEVTVNYAGGLPRRLGAAVLGRKPRVVGSTITAKRLKGPDTLPQAVVVLPEMRQHFHEPYYMGMSASTPIEEIKSLCDSNGIHMVELDAQPNNERITQLSTELTAELH